MVGEHDTPFDHSTEHKLIREFMKRQVAFNKDTVSQLHELRAKVGLARKNSKSSSSKSISLVETDQQALGPLERTLKDLHITV
jgi:hypothetical protein